MNVKTLADSRAFRLGLLVVLVAGMAAVAGWMILSVGEGGEVAERVGLNAQVPIARSERLDSSKLRVYEGDLDGGASLSLGMEDAAAAAGDGEGEDDGVATETGAAELARRVGDVGGSMRGDVELGPLGGGGSPGGYDAERARLARENARLSARAAQLEDVQRAMSRNDEMLQQSLATLSGMAAPEDKKRDGPDEPPSTDLSRVRAVRRGGGVVSALAQPPDSARGWGAARDRRAGFSSVRIGGGDAPPPGNTLRAVVDRTVTVRMDDYVALRLLEPAEVGGVRLPRNAPLVARARIAGKRMQLVVRSVAAGDRIVPVSISAFDLDGQEGVYIPLSDGLEAASEVGAEIAASMAQIPMGASSGGVHGQGVSAKDQVLGNLGTDAGRSVMQGVGRMVQRRLREVRVRLKAGYRLLLVEREAEGDS